jgi:hypothetical protein
MPEKGLTVLRADHPTHTMEAEGLVVDCDTPGLVRLVLDDGVELVADRAALLDALEVPRVAA